jgi:hypothetical protein
MEALRVVSQIYPNRHEARSLPGSRGAYGASREAATCQLSSGESSKAEETPCDVHFGCTMTLGQT